MVKDFLLELTRYQLGRLRIKGVPMPTLTRFSKSFELINLHRISNLVPFEMLPTFYSDDFLFVFVIPYLSEDEYTNLYDLLAHLQSRGVNWCIQLPIDAPYLDYLFLSSPKFTISPVAITIEGKSLSYLNISTYPHK